MRGVSRTRKLLAAIRVGDGAYRVIADTITHLKRILTNHFNYYHHWRTHLLLGVDSPESRSVQSPDLGKVVRIPEVVGLHHHYERLAA